MSRISYVAWLPSLAVALCLGQTSFAEFDDGQKAVSADQTQSSPDSQGDESSRPRKIVLIAGAKDEHHGPGTHDYEATVNTIKAALEASNIAGQVKVETVLNGWPSDPAVLDDADTIFLISAGADRNESDHPFLVDDRLQVLEKHMQRGCGLVMLHWSVFVPIKHEAHFSEWLGGFFDYERGDDPRGWHSAITFATAKIQPHAKHEIAKGVPPFNHRDEYYYQIRFRNNDDRVTPIVTVKLPDVEEPQVVGWAVERKNGGRSFGFTGGHFQKSWDDDAYRTLMLNAICWTAKVKIPAAGIRKELAFDDQWTPKPHLGKEDLPKEVEEDWVDGRIRESDVGPFYTASIVVPELEDPSAGRSKPIDDRKLPINPNMVVKALAIELGGKDGLPPAAVLFDKARMTLRCGWTGGFLNFSDRRFGLLEKPTIGGEVMWAIGNDARWVAGPRQDEAFRGVQSPAQVEYEGLRLDGDHVTLSYRVDEMLVSETPSLVRAGDEVAFSRTLAVGPTRRWHELPIFRWPGATQKDWPSAEHAIVFERNDEVMVVATAFDEQDESAFVMSVPASGDGVNLIVRESEALAASGQPQRSRVRLSLWRGPAAKADAVIEALGATNFSIEQPEPPARRWGEPLVTRGETVEVAGTPFAVDTITIPYDNPHKALFYTSGFDFAPDGTCYVCTAHGDVWKVSGIDDDLAEIRWQRFATGLYEPLGLKIRNGEIFVLGRDQITRLHDSSGDGEADFYENFNDDLTDLGQAHAYAMCLETDSAGNFYFLKSGAPETPHGGTLLQLSADGKNLDVFATGFRHPNGLGVGPGDMITAADNEGNWVPVTRIDIVEKNAFCGHVPTAHLDPEPSDCGMPLCWLPRVVDNSAGGQVWVPEGQWGPLAGSLLHLSFGQCTANLILKEQVNGVWQGGAVRLPIPPFLSGVCRGRFRTSGDGADGHLYVCGLDGWQTTATRDGCLQRVRYVGAAVNLPTALNAYENGIELQFAEPLDPQVAAKADRYAIDVWNYRWSQDYGSADYAVSDATRVGRDSVRVKGVTVSEDGRTVFVSVDRLEPVMQLRLQAGLKTAAGSELPLDYYGTVHRLRPARSVPEAVATSTAD